MSNQLMDFSIVKDILRDSQIGLWYIELDEGKEPRMFGNDVYCSIMGQNENMTPEDAYRFWYDRIDDECRDSIDETLDELKQGKHAEVQYLWNHPVKGAIYIRCGGTRDYQYKNGIRFRGSHQDISEIVQLEQQRIIKENLEMIKALCENLNNVYTVDLNTEEITVYRNTADSLLPPRLLKCIADGGGYCSAIEIYIDECVYPDDREMMREAVSISNIRKELSDKNTFTTYFRVVRNGAILYFSFKVVKLGDDNEYSKVILGFTNIDAEMRKEQEQRQILSDALIAAEHANKAKTTFLNNMSHDIRTPMNAIVGFTALASTHAEQPELVRDYLKKIMTSSNHLLSLINDVLDMSRIESGTVKIEEKECNLPDIMHDIKNIVQADIRSKQLEFFIDTVDVINESIICDKLRLDQILLNCLSNAIKFSKPGGAVGVRVIQKPNAPSGYADFDFLVRDSGIGMHPEFMEHIFEPFVREQTTTISGIPGTGLGMAITKNIVDMMGGSISVTSELGVGSEFTISLRFRLGDNPKKVGIIKELSGVRALVADDDYNTCVSVTRMLKSIGLRSEFTTSGKEAVLRTKTAMEENDNFSVYIIDWLMPDMNGIEVVRRIRQEIGNDVPIIILTAYDWSDIKEEAQEAGVTAFCSKPIFMSELHDILLFAGHKESVAAKKEIDFTGKRLLLVEDIELNREIAETILVEGGFAVDSAENGKIAVEMLKESEPGYYDLILMDIQMPVMDGYEATRAIRALDNIELATIPILAMTANAFEEDKKQALSAGMNGHLVKPIRIEELYAALEEYLNK